MLCVKKEGDHAGKTCFLSISHLGCATLPQPQAKGRHKPFFEPDSLVPLGPQRDCVQKIHRPCHSSPNSSCLLTITLVLRAPRAVLISPTQPNAGLSTPAHGPRPHFSSAQCHQSMMQQLGRSAGLHPHCSPDLPFREQLALTAP